MDKPGCVNKLLLTGMLLTLCQAEAANPGMPVRINNYAIPAVFANALYQGMTVPVFIRYDGDTDTQRSRQKIADALLSIKDSEFRINQVTLSELPERTELSPEIKKLLTELQDKSIGDGQRVNLGPNAVLSLDTGSFYLELTVRREAMQAALLPRSNMLAESTSEKLSSVLNYSFGSYYNKYKNNDSNSSYLTLDNTWSLREHHLNLNGSVYGIGSGSQQGDLYRAMYERDYHGRRLALGMVDTWNLQSIASMSALSSSRIYGVSYGNKSSTQIEDNTLSLLPVTVFLPAAGEVYIYRDGKLLSIQNFPMGSYEIDTSRLPFGIYDVNVQVVVNGREVSSRIANINKTFSRKSSVTGGLSWQVFGGSLTYDRKDYRKQERTNYGEKDTWIAGLAVATRLPMLSGVGLTSTLYGFDNTGVNELEVNLAVNDSMSINQQGMLATDGSWQSISTLNLSLPEGYGSFWGSRQYSRIGDRVSVQQNDYWTLGMTGNLGKIVPHMGSLSVSQTRNNYTGSTYTNADYSQGLFSNRYASVSLRTGIQSYQYDNRERLNDKYVNIDITIPFGTWLSTGISSQNGNMLANATLRKRLDNSAFTQVGASVSKRIKQNSNSNQYDSDNVSVNGFASYDTKYNAGTLSASHSSEHSSNISLSSQGSVAWTPQEIYLGKGTQNAGVVVNTRFNENGTMIAQINGQNYPLTGKSNFISLPAYAEYKVELMNDKNSEDSVDIINGRRSQIVLYPGNVSVLNPEVKQLVTVFGRMKKGSGGYYANMDIHNHIGKTRLDDNGEFAMDVDKRYPIITLIDNRGSLCEASLDLQKARGAVWLGDITCEMQQQVASRTGENSNVY
ncbi:CS1-pili formation C-terminal domain-containing protein [Citrobacter sp. JGM124]|uniref:TcfC E-set like domain-containing protein n=1 Tax=Citrobacter sp. JGM124 TaxID=2799789 RepID=UPI001BA8296E|nr:CS1-pili formation C-terminal domain-containing protein [Citrobacter sp. JGM124]MBS0847894.1 CS1-pili formation C-terminal domain-containing protein [Citrobacter sp. JGM124]